MVKIRTRDSMIYNYYFDINFKMKLLFWNEDTQLEGCNDCIIIMQLWDANAKISNNFKRKDCSLHEKRESYSKHYKVLLASTVTFINHNNKFDIANLLVETL